MNNTILKLSALALGASLLSTAGAATVKSHVSVPTTLVAAANFGQKATSVSLQTWDVTDGNSIYLALCVEPATPMATDKKGSYSNGGDFTLFDNNDAVARLYSGFYSSITGSDAKSKTNSLAFQLALWEVYKDDSSLTADTGALYFKWAENTAPAKQSVLNSAVDMVNYATNKNNAITTRYDYTQFVATGSQTVVYASPLAAVPEPSTYAMLGLGLALVGFTARRRSQR